MPDAAAPTLASTKPAAPLGASFADVRLHAERGALELESEAERAAEAAMAGRKVRIDAGDGAPAAGQGGRRLEGDVRASMQRRFRYDFAAVRVHDDGHADGVARANDALAVTHGGNIFFARGAYRPRSDAGAHLLAHELAHTVQGSPLALRVPKPPAGKSIDVTKLDIGDVKPIDYFEFVRTGGSRHVTYTSSESTLSSHWRLFDAKDAQVDDNLEVGGGAYDLTADTLKSWVDAHGSAVLGTWTLRYEKGAYYAQRQFPVAELDKPAALSGELTAALFQVRDLPGPNGNVIGKLTGDRGVAVTVTNKSVAPFKASESTLGTWYHVVFRVDGAGMKANSQGWIRAEGVEPVMPWAMFKQQLNAFEKEHHSLSLSERITVLRQMGHDKALPFDDVIGTKAGTVYRDTQQHQPGTWQLLREAQYVEPPGGTAVAMDHVFAGLDVLPRKISNAKMWGFSLGENSAAATWAGDLGSAAADAMLGFDNEWEKTRGIEAPGTANRAARLADVYERYYTTRAPERQLLADIDSWGIDALRGADGQFTSVESLLAAYYEKTVPATGGKAEPAGRKGAVEKFYKGYGLKTTMPAKKQPTARSNIVEHVTLFAKMWIRNRDKLEAMKYRESHLVNTYVQPITDRFLDWLDDLAKSTGATVK